MTSRLDEKREENRYSEDSDSSYRDLGDYKLEEISESKSLARLMERPVAAFGETTALFFEVANPMMTMCRCVIETDKSEVQTADDHIRLHHLRMAAYDFEAAVMPVFHRAMDELHRVRSEAIIAYNRMVNITSDSSYQLPIISIHNLSGLNEAKRMIVRPVEEVLELVEEMNEFLKEIENLKGQKQTTKPTKVREDHTIIPNIEALIDGLYIDPQDLLAEFNEYFSQLDSQRSDTYRSDNDVESSSIAATQNRLGQQHGGSAHGGSSMRQEGNASFGGSDMAPDNGRMQPQNESAGNTRKMQMEATDQDGPGNILVPEKNKEQKKMDAEKGEVSTQASANKYTGSDFARALREFFKNETQQLSYINRENSELKRYLEFNSEKFSSSELANWMKISIHKGFFKLAGAPSKSRMEEEQVNKLESILDNQQIEDVCMWTNEDTSYSKDSQDNRIVQQIVAVMKNHPEGFEPGSHKLGLYHGSRKEVKKDRLKVTLSCSLQFTYELDLDVYKNMDCTILSQKSGKLLLQIPTSSSQVTVNHMTISNTENKQKIYMDHSLNFKTKNPTIKRIRLSQDGNWSAIHVEDQKFSILNEQSAGTSAFKYTSFSGLKDVFQDQEVIQDLFLEPIAEVARGPSLVVAVLSSLQYIYLVRVFAKETGGSRDYSNLEFDVAGKFSTRLKSEEGFDDHRINGIVMDHHKDVLFVVSNFQYDDAAKFSDILTQVYLKRKERELTLRVAVSKEEEGEDKKEPKLDHPSTATSRMVMIRAYQLIGDLKAARVSTDRKNQVLVGNYHSPLMWPAFCKSGSKGEQLCAFTNQDDKSIVDVLVFGIKGFYNIFAAEYSKLAKVKPDNLFNQDDDTQATVGIDMDFCNTYFDFEEAVVNLSIRREPQMRANKLKVQSSTDFASKEYYKIMPDLYIMLEKGSMANVSVFAKPTQEVIEEEEGN